MIETLASFLAALGSKYILLLTSFKREKYRDKTYLELLYQD